VQKKTGQKTGLDQGGLPEKKDSKTKAVKKGGGEDILRQKDGVTGKKRKEKSMSVEKRSVGKNITPVC